eukprot:c29113_g1_i2 orf=1563-3893(+)
MEHRHDARIISAVQHIPTSGLKHDMDMYSKPSKSREKHLDYNAPLLSVRRLNGYHAPNGYGGIAPCTLPDKHYKHSAELSSEPLRKPGAVPFMWEQSPGKPKPRDIHEAAHSTPPSSLSGRPYSRNCAAIQSECQQLQPWQEFPDPQAVSDHISDGIEQKQSECSLGLPEQQSHGRNFQQSTKRQLAIGEPELLSLLNSKDSLSFYQGFSAHSSSHAFVEGNSTTQPMESTSEHHFENDSFLDATEAMAPSEVESSFVSTELSDGSGLSTHRGRHVRDYMMHRFLPAAKDIDSDSRQAWSTRQTQKSFSPVINGRLWKFDLPITPRRPTTPPKEGLAMVREVKGTDFTSKACGAFWFRLKSDFLGILKQMPFNASRPNVEQNAQFSFSHHGKLDAQIYDSAFSESEDEEVVVRTVRAALNEKPTRKEAWRVYDGCPRSEVYSRRNHLNSQRESKVGETATRRSVYYDALNRFSPAASPTSSADYRENHFIYQHASKAADTLDSTSVIDDDDAGRFSPQRTDGTESGCTSPYENGSPIAPVHEDPLRLPKELGDGAVSKVAASSFFKTATVAVSDSYHTRTGSRSSIQRRYTTSNVGQRSDGVSRSGSWDQTWMTGLNPSLAMQTSVSRQTDLHRHETSVHLRGESGKPESLQAIGYKKLGNNADQLQIGFPTSGFYSYGCTDANQCETFSIPKDVGWPLGIASKSSSSVNSGIISSRQIRPWIERVDSQVNVLSFPLPNSPKDSWLLKVLPKSASSRSKLRGTSVAQLAQINGNPW